nr:hypothetical protein [Lactobacillus sp.]
MAEIIVYQLKKIHKYKLQIVTNIINVLLNFLVQFYMWKIVLSSKTTVFQKMDDVVCYYFSVAILSILVNSTASEMGELFKHGKMDKELVRPVNLFFFKIKENIAFNFCMAMYVVPIFSILVFSCCGDYLRTIRIAYLPLFIATTVGGFIII